MVQIISKAVGIDLGTTNSAVAVLDPKDASIVIHRHRATKATTTPSCVWKDPKTGAIVVGANAFRRRGTLPQPIGSVKRLMGKRVRLMLSDQEVSPEEVSAEILREMKRQIEEDVASFESADCKWMVERAIVTVPAYFDQPQVDATRRAAEMAGLEVIELLHEPTAAACHHCWRTGTRNGVFLVYDFGGGTFDVTVLRCTEGVFQVLGISGNTQLGGDDLDAAIAEHLRQRLLAEGYALELDPANDVEDAFRESQLRFLAEGLKKGLSSATEFLLRDQGSLKDKDGMPVVIDLLFQRAEVEALIVPIVERTIPYCHVALELAERKGVTLAEVDAVVLAGGSTHIPLVREMVRQALCRDGQADGPRARCEAPVYESVDTIVALGAAIRAAATGGLSFYDAGRTFRITLNGTGVTGARETHFGGSVVALAGGADPRGARMRLRIPDLDFEDEVQLTAEGGFSFRQVPLNPSADNLIGFELIDAAGRVLATAGRAVVQSADRVRPTGGNVVMAVMSKAISLEVSRGGNLVMRELMPANQTLPARAEFRFVHPGGTELLRMPLFQHKRRIQEIRVAVPATLPKGTEILFDLEVDKLSFITVRGKVGEIGFDAQVELPPERALPDESEVSRLSTRFHEGLLYLPKGRQAVQSMRYRKACEAYERARAQGARAQALHEFEEMEEIVAGMAQAPQTLQPPKQVFEETVAECVELNDHVGVQAAEMGRVHDPVETARAIAAQREQGEKAWADVDQRAWADVQAMLDGIRNHLLALAKSVTPPPPPLPEGIQAAHAIEAAEEQAQRLAHLAASRERKDVQDEAEEIQRSLARLSGEVQKNPRTVQEKVSALRARVEQLLNALRGQQTTGGAGRHVEDYSKDEPR